MKATVAMPCAQQKATVRPTMAGDLTVAMQKRSIVPVIAVTMLAAVVAVSAAVVVSTKLRAHSGPKVMDSPKLVATATGSEPARPSVPRCRSDGCAGQRSGKPGDPGRPPQAIINDPERRSHSDGKVKMLRISHRRDQVLVIRPALPASVRNLLRSKRSIGRKAATRGDFPKRLS